MYAIGTTSDGAAATPLIGTTLTTSDGSGDSGNANANAGNGYNSLPAGSFTITGQYSCPTSSSQVYLVATGGNPGLASPTNNHAIAEMGFFGNCQALVAAANTTVVSLDEVTTVGTVAMLATYMNSYATIGVSFSDLPVFNQQVTQITELVDSRSGYAPGPSLPAGYSVPVSTLYTLSDIVAACVNSVGGAATDSTQNDGTACGQLFSLATPAGQPRRTDTIGALIDILRNPATNTAALYNLTPSKPPFQPTLSTAPATWALGIAANVALPVFSPAGGTYAAAQTVTIADASTTSTIYYTTDGSTPTIASPVYSGALQVSASETLTAVATLNGATGPAASAPFTITNGTAPRLAFLAQPGAVAAGTTLSAPVQVTIADASGNPISGASGAVTLGFGVNPSNGVLLGTTTVHAVNGVATFSGLSVDKVGAGYTLKAMSVGLTSTVSNSFNVTGAQTCTYYVDSVGGSDTNDGMSIATPWQHIAAIPVVSDGATICLRRGSYFRETLAIGVPVALRNGITVEDYGPSNLDMPMLDSSDIIPPGAWSQVPGSSPAVYQASVTGPGPSLPNLYGSFPIPTLFINVFECKSAPCTPQGAGGNDLFMVSQETMSDVSANPGSYSIPGQSPAQAAQGTGPADPTNLTIYISPSDGSNPTTNGYIYSYSHRFEGLELSGLNVIATNIASKKGALNNGGITQEGPSGGSATFNHVESDQGGKHNMFCTGGCVVNNSRMVDEYYRSGDMFVAYDITSSGLPITLNNVTLINGATTTGNSVDGFDAHTGDSTLMAGFAINGGLIQSLNGARFSGGAVSATVLNVTGLTCVDLVACVSSETGTTNIANSQAVVSASIPAINFFQVENSSVNMTIASTAMCGTTSQRAAIDSDGLDNVSLSITDSLLYIGGSYPNTGVNLAGNNTSLALNRTVIQSDQLYGVWAKLSSSSYTGDYNAFVAPNQGQGNIDGTGYVGLAAWQAATGQDAHSAMTGDASAACTLPNFSLTGPSAGPVNQTSGLFTLTPNRGFTGTVTVTLLGAAASGLSPVVLTFDHSSAAQSFALTPKAAGTISLTTGLQGTASSPAFLPPATLLYTVQ